MEFHLEDLLGTNQIPTERQYTQIRKLIREGELDIHELDATAERDFRYTAQRLALRRYLRRYRRLVSGISQIPVELLVKIFTFAVEACEYPEPNELTPPLSFTNVCKFWRKAAFEAPHLWTRIDVSFGSTHRNWKRFYTAEAWLKRGKDLPRSISMSMTNLSHRWLNDTVQMLVPYSHLLQTLCLDIQTDSLHDVLKKFFANPTPLLEHLDLHISSDEDTTLRLWNIQSAPLNAPLLRSLSISFSKSPAMYVTFIPWAQLKKLVLGPIKADQNLLRKYLYDCRNLEECILAFNEVNPSAQITPLKIVVPELQTLSLAFHHRKTVIPVLSTLTLPKLTSLKIWYNMEKGSLRWFHGWPQDVFFDFRWRSLFNLRSLTLHGVPIRSNELHTLLVTMDSLLELKLINCDPCIDTFFYEMLTYSRVSGELPAAPLLRKLVIEGLKDTLDGNAMTTMIASRWYGIGATHVRRIQHVRLIHDEGSIRNWALARSLFKLQSEGLYVDYRGDC